MSTGNKKATAAIATRSHIIATARRLFVRGYERVSTPEIVAGAGVTRGALYHHFADKRALFDAVLRVVAVEIVEQVERAARPHAAEPMKAILAGSFAFLDACLKPDTRQIFLTDGPSVLGWSRWRAIDGEHGLGSLKAGLAALYSSRGLAAEAVEQVAHLISGALNEAAFYIAERGNDAPAAARMRAQIERMIGAMT